MTQNAYKPKKCSDMNEKPGMWLKRQEWDSQVLAIFLSEVYRLLLPCFSSVFSLRRDFQDKNTDTIVVHRQEEQRHHNLPAELVQFLDYSCLTRTYSIAGCN